MSFESVSQPIIIHGYVSKCPYGQDATADTHINESLQILIQISQIFFPLVILCDQSLLALKELLPCLLELLPFGVFMIDTSNRKFVFVGVAMLWIEFQKLFQRDQRQGKILVTERDSPLAQNFMSITHRTTYSYDSQAVISPIRCLCS